MLYRRSAPRTRKRIKLTALALAIISVAFIAATLSGCNATKTVAGTALGSYYSVEYTGKNVDDQIKAFMADVDLNFAAEGTGDIGKINAAPAGEPVKVGETTFALLELAFEI